MVIFRKNMPDGIIGEVPLTNGVGGDVIGMAELEKVGSNVIIRVDAADMPEAVIQGFALGSYSLYEEVKDVPHMTQEELHNTVYGHGTANLGNPFITPVMPPYNMKAEETMAAFRAKLGEAKTDDV